MRSSPVEHSEECTAAYKRYQQISKGNNRTVTFFVTIQLQILKLNHTHYCIFKKSCPIYVISCYKNGSRLLR